MAELVITLTDGRVIRQPLGSDPLTIGRDTTCDVTIDDPGTSRRHVRFSATTAGFVVEDLGSKNGTLVNDAPATSQPLRDGDQVLIGSTLAVFHDRSSQPQTSVVITDDATISHATRYAARDKQLELSRQRLQMIYELGERLTTVQDRNQLLENAVSICSEMLHFERVAIGVRRPKSRLLDWPVVHNLRGASGELTISRTLFNRALEHGERAIFTEDDPRRNDPTVSMVQHGIRSAMCVPLIHGDQVLGVIYGDKTRSSVAYTDEDIDFLAGIAQQVSIGLINAQLVEEQRETARLKHDIEVARGIQTDLFPAKLPNSDRLRVAALNDPGQRVSGDYYDVIELADGRVWCLLADVTGEGVAAALLGANLQATVRATACDSDTPADLLSRWNRLIFHNTNSSKFITCVLALIDMDKREIRLSSAGHCTPYILRGGGAAPEPVETEPGFPLGVVEDATYETAVIRPGDAPFIFFTYTDGVIEAIDEGGNAYTTERLVEVLSTQTELNPQALVKLVRKSVSTFADTVPQSDDITIMATLVG